MIRPRREVREEYLGINYFNDITDRDPYNTSMRTRDRFSFNRITKGISENIDDNKNNWINNYNYNKIFNIRNPPIKSVLEKYLLDDNFNNFYLFFVASNSKGPTDLETCDKQVQLIYDTRKFMDMIANTNAKGITREECDAL
jgi:hypothetical protein